MTRAALLLVATASVLVCPRALAEVTVDQCIDANTRAQSLKRNGRFAEARGELRQCMDATCPEMVSSDCARRLEELDRAQPTILFDVKDTEGSDLTEVRVSIDGRLLSERLDGAALPIDPGSHSFVFEAQGRPPVVGTFVLKETEKGRRERIVIATPSPGGAQRTAGVVTASAGAAGLVAGAVFGWLANDAKNRYLQQCGSAIGAPPGMCNEQGISGQSDAANKATLATAFFVGGGALVAAGAALFFTAPHGPHALGAPAMGVGPGGWFVRGVF